MNIKTMISSAFSGSLMSSLTLPARGKPIDSAEDFLKSDTHSLVIPEGSAEEGLLMSAQNGLVRDMWIKAQRQEYYNIPAIFKFSQLMDHPDHVFFTDATGIWIFIQFEMSTKSG